MCIDRLSTLGLRGNFWLNCLSRLQPPRHRHQKRDAENIYVPTDSQYMDQSWSPTESVLPDKVMIDGHRFETNHPNQSQETTDALDAPVDLEDVVYEDIGANLRRWEVDMEDDDDY